MLWVRWLGIDTRRLLPRIKQQHNTYSKTHKGAQPKPEPTPLTGQTQIQDSIIYLLGNDLLYLYSHTHSRNRQAYDNALGVMNALWSPCCTFLAVGSFDSKVRLVSDSVWVRTWLYNAVRNLCFERWYALDFGCCWYCVDVFIIVVELCICD